MPRWLLDFSGYLPTQQNRIESLSLITAFRCGLNIDGKSSPALSGFNCLRRFSWIGLSAKEDFLALHDALQANRKSLEELSLDLIVCSEDNNAFVLEVFKPVKSRGITLLLKALSLSAFSFHSITYEMIHAFNLGNLRSLKLLRCPDSLSFLEAVVASCHAIRLTSFELVLGSETPETPHALQIFLQAFKGLENLFISINNPEDIEYPYWRSILHRRATLKRIVYHERSGHSDLGMGRWRLLSAIDTHRRPIVPRLESIGICSSPSLMV